MPKTQYRDEEGNLVNTGSPAPKPPEEESAKPVKPAPKEPASPPKEA